MQQCDYLLASTTTFADPDTETALLAEAGNPSGHGVYITPGKIKMIERETHPALPCKTP